MLFKCLIHQFYLTLANDHNIFKKIISYRDNYIRNNPNYYDFFYSTQNVGSKLVLILWMDSYQSFNMLQSKWGYQKVYIHPPCKPTNIVTPGTGYQMWDAIIFTHYIKEINALQYCTTFQMHVKSVFVQLFNTCGILNNGHFSFTYVTLS